MLTDQEVICEFMEPRPTCTLSEWRNGNPEDYRGNRIYPAWWKQPRNDASRDWKHYSERCNSLDACHEVEGKLTWAQWWSYESELSLLPKVHNATALAFIHATAEQKIKALGRVLRKEEPR